MTALANSFERIWRAKNRLPHRTWWGTPGSRKSPAVGRKLVSSLYDRVFQLREFTQRTTPIVIAIALNILR
jgi:hypothetical protein